jgi:hypothetical protein
MFVDSAPLAVRAITLSLTTDASTMVGFPMMIVWAGVVVRRMSDDPGTIIRIPPRHTSVELEDVSSDEAGADTTAPIRSPKTRLKRT